MWRNYAIDFEKNITILDSPCQGHRSMENADLLPKTIDNGHVFWRQIWRFDVKFDVKSPNTAKRILNFQFWSEVHTRWLKRQLYTEELQNEVDKTTVLSFDTSCEQHSSPHNISCLTTFPMECNLNIFVMMCLLLPRRQLFPYFCSRGLFESINQFFHTKFWQIVTITV